MKKIYLGGCPFGGENIGDDAILSSLLNNFGGINSELTICKTGENCGYLDEYVAKKGLNTKIYRNKFYAPPILGLSINGRRNPIKAYFNNQLDKKHISSSNLLICGGGTLITDLPWQIIKLLAIAKKLGVPGVLFGVGMAEIKDKNSVNHLKSALNQIEDIYVRDEFVKAKLVKIGVLAEKIRICYDPAITLLPNKKWDINKSLEKNEIEVYTDNKIKIGISLSSENDIRKETNFKAINSIIQYLIKNYNAAIFLIPTNYRNNADYNFMKALSNQPNVVLVKNRFEPEDLIQFLSEFAIVLSSRLHLNIFASISGTPFVGLVRNSKIADYSNVHLLNSYHFEDINGQDILFYLDYLIEKNNSIRKTIINNVEQMKIAHNKCVNEILKKYLE